MAGKGSRILPYTLLHSTRNWVLNAKPVLLLHCDGPDESTTFKDSGGTGHIVTAIDNAQIDTAQSWRGQSGLFDGVGNYLTIPDHADWNISTNWTFDLWINPHRVDVVKTIICHYEDDNNYWQLYQINTDLFFLIKSEGLPVLSFRPEDCLIANVWQHTAICKIGNEYGAYMGGSQIEYESDSSMDTFTGSLYIGQFGDNTRFFDGHMDEIRIVQGNPFGAAPVSGLTDTIKVPYTPYISFR